MFSCRFQTLATTLVSAAVADFDVLDYSTTSAGAVLDTLAILSSSPDALGTESQVGAIQIGDHSEIFFLRIDRDWSADTCDSLSYKGTFFLSADILANCYYSRIS